MTLPLSRPLEGFFFFPGLAIGLISLLSPRLLGQTSFGVRELLLPEDLQLPPVQINYKSSVVADIQLVGLSARPQSEQRGRDGTRGEVGALWGRRVASF